MEGRTLYIFTTVQIVAVAAALWLVFSRPGPWDLQRCIGAGLVFVGVAGIGAARYQLGKSFAIRAEAHQLVTRGGLLKGPQSDLRVWHGIRCWICGGPAPASLVAAGSGDHHHANPARPPRSPSARSRIWRRLP